jgi:hypothetical protein
MSFLASFATGFATQATKDIEERDKELREKADKYWEALLKEREKATLRADKRVEELTTQSKQIRTLLPDITDAQLTTILHSGQSDTLLKALIEAQTKQGRTFKAGELITDVPESQISLSDYLSSETRRGVPKLEMPAMEDRLPFGLRSTAMQDARAKYLKEAGVSGEEKQEAFKRPVEGGRINYAALAAPEKEKRTRMEIAKQNLQDQFLDAKTDDERAVINLAANALNEFGKLKEPGDFNKQYIEPLKIEAGKLEKQINEEKDPNKRKSLQKEFANIDARVRVLSGVGKALKETGDDADKAPSVSGSTMLNRAFHAGASEGITKIGNAHFTNVPDLQGNVIRVFTPTNPEAQRYGTALGHAAVKEIVERYKDPVTGNYPKWILDSVPTVPGAKVVDNKPVFIDLSEATKAAQEATGQKNAPGLGARATPQQATQASAPAKTEPKQMPTGAKLTEYANAYFAGDVSKAKNYLRSQGYKE